MSDSSVKKPSSPTRNVSFSKEEPKKSSIPSLICPNCGSTAVEHHEASGASICTDCGVVVEENAIVSSVEFVEGAGGSSSMVGQFVSATSSKAYSSAARGRYGGFSRDSRETTLANGRRRIQDVASRMRLSNLYVDAAHRLYTIAVERNFVQGRRTAHVVAACLYIACRQEKSQHMLIDFSDALQINVYTLGTCFLKFRRLLGLKLELLDPALYVYRFAAHLGLDEEAHAVSVTALRLVGRMKRDWIVSGRRPAGICAAALLISSRAHGFSREAYDVTRILRVCGLTVRKRVKEFSLTPSAQLSLEQFQKTDLPQECDPPIFTRNRVLEARARAITEGNEELLQSGALDDEGTGKRARKWRSMSKRRIKQDEDFEKLYKSIEEQFEAGTLPKDNEVDDLERQQDQQIITKEQDDSEEAADVQDGTGLIDLVNDKGASAENPEDQVVTTKNAEEVSLVQIDQANKGDGTVKSDDTKVSISSPKGSTGEILFNEKSKHLTPEKRKVAETWKKAYPRGPNGKLLVLPEDSTAEERMPSTAPFEAKLDFKAWKTCKPASLDEEIDSIFRSEKERESAEEIFNKINKDYLEAQARKAEVLKKAQEEEKIKEDSGQAPETTSNRPKKYKKRKKNSNQTTEEQLLDAMAARKVSKKINYDALSSIFDESGSFSTDLATDGDHGSMFELI